MAISQSSTSTSATWSANGVTVLSTDATGEVSARVNGSVQALSNLASVGIGQTWQAPSRAVGTTYTNTRGRPILVNGSFTCSAASAVVGLSINGTAVYGGASNNVGGAVAFSILVPNGATYVTTASAGTLTFVSWQELG